MPKIITWRKKIFIHSNRKTFPIPVALFCATLLLVDGTLRFDYILSGRNKVEYLVLHDRELSTSEISRSLNSTKCEKNINKIYPFKYDSKELVSGTSHMKSKIIISVCLLCSIAGQCMHKYYCEVHELCTGFSTAPDNSCHIAIGEPRLLNFTHNLGQEDTAESVYREGAKIFMRSKFLSRGSFMRQLAFFFIFIELIFWTSILMIRQNKLRV